MTSLLKTISIIIKGKVQGVYFRQSTKDIAEQLHITGEVANQKDGSVIIRATGTNDQLQQLISWCNDGPSGATVAEVLVKEIPLQAFETFRIVRAY